MAKVTDEICQRFGNDRTRMMDIVLEVQARFGCVSHEAMEQIARALQDAEMPGACSFRDRRPAEERLLVVF
jgi:[NiFe] hydrogenase diaphorase moiety large subunit